MINRCCYPYESAPPPPSRRVPRGAAGSTAGPSSFVRYFLAARGVPTGYTAGLPAGGGAPSMKLVLTNHICVKEKVSIQFQCHLRTKAMIFVAFLVLPKKEKHRRQGQSSNR